MFQNIDKDLLCNYQHGHDPFCVSLLTDRHLKVGCHTDFVYRLSDKGAFTSVRDL